MYGSSLLSAGHTFHNNQDDNVLTNLNSLVETKINTVNTLILAKRAIKGEIEK